MTHFTSSHDGTRIAFSKQGSGKPLILIDGAFCHRKFGANVKLPVYLKDHFTVFTYDRRGKGESHNTLPYSIDREFEDLQAVINEAGGDALVYGISSGAALALEAVKSGVKINKLAIFEAPYITDNSRPPFPEDYLQHIQALLNNKKNGKAVQYFMTTGVGLPKPVVWMMKLMPAWKQMKAIAPTLEYDTLMLKDFGSGKPFTKEDWDKVDLPVLVISGAKSATWNQNSMIKLAEVLPNAKYFELKDQSHLVAPAKLAPCLIDFF